MDNSQLVEALRKKFGNEFRATESGGRETLIEWLVATHEEVSDDAARTRVAALEQTGVIRYVPPASLPSGEQLTLEAARYGTAVLPESAEGLWQIGPRT